MSKEIVRAGVRYNNIVYDGFNHGECFKKLPTEANMVNVEQGFITNDGEFVDREKAFTIARKAHQLEYDYGIQKTLISEDIHINWLHKKDKTIADLEAKLAEKQSRIQELNDMYEDLLCAKGTEHELKQAKEDVEMLDERNLCLFSLLYETLEKQGCENITSTIEQMTNLHLNKCSHWYKNNRVCDELQKQLAEKDEEIEDLKAQRHIYLNRSVDECNKITDLEFELQHKDQDKISFCVEQLRKTKFDALMLGGVVQGETFFINSEHFRNYIDNQIKQLKEIK